MSYDPIAEVFLEGIITLKYLLDRGWTIGELDYGERRLDVATTLTMRKGVRMHICRNFDDFRTLLEHDIRISECNFENINLNDLAVEPR